MATGLRPQLDLRRGGDRFATRIDWLDSKHSFSFGPHYDSANTHFGLLLVSNDDVVAPGSGFETHPHRDMEIVTWVLDGGLVHQDSTGHNGVIYPGLAQRMSAGTGILHSEKNDAWRLEDNPRPRDPVHFVQMWVVPDAPRVTPGYEQLDITEELRQRRPRHGRVGHGARPRRERDPDPAAGRCPARRPAAGRQVGHAAHRAVMSTCTSPAERSRWKAPGSCQPGTPSGSPWRRASG